MNGYGQYCPVAKGAEVFAERWTPLVLRELLRGSTRFNDLHRGVPLMSRTLLSQRLKKLEIIGVITRRPGTQGMEYHLTPAGHEFAPVVRQLGEWAQKWFRTTFDRNELDVGVLMWDISKSVQTRALGAKPVLLRFDFPDLPATRRTWWFVNEAGEVDLCPTDPGGEVDLFVTTPLETMTRVWMGERPVAAAIASGEMKVTGTRELRHRFREWLGASAFAGIRNARTAHAS
jgi:DNA-binding HxlR family transcriptional regulator